MVVCAKRRSLRFTNAIVDWFDGAERAFVCWARGFGFEFGFEDVWTSVVRDWDVVAV